GVWHAVATGATTGRAYDLLFNVSLAAEPVVCVPVYPVTTPDLVEGDDSGFSSSDDVTFIVNPTFLVVTTPLLLVELLEGDVVLGSAYADDTGAAYVMVD